MTSFEKLEDEICKELCLNTMKYCSENVQTAFESFKKSPFCEDIDKSKIPFTHGFFAGYGLRKTEERKAIEKENASPNSNT